jgi:hypothetical protein
VVAVCEQDGTDGRAAEFLIIPENALCPLAVLVAGVDQYHSVAALADEVIIAATWVKSCPVIDMHNVDMG